MTEFDQSDPPDFLLRVFLGFTAFVLSAVLAIAMRLEPDSRGFGTHEQLGLPPCQFYQFTGMQCPHCGMTTSFANVVRGRFDSAWRANPLGILLSVMFAVCIPWCLVTAVTGSWVLTAEPFRWFVRGTVGYLILAVVLWVLRLTGL